MMCYNLNVQFQGQSVNARYKIISTCSWVHPAFSMHCFSWSRIF